jgi:SAM-dependent methyltransferase
MSDIAAILRKHQLVGPFPQEQYEQRMHTTLKKQGGARFLNAVDAAIAQGWTPESFERTYNAMHGDPLVSLYATAHAHTTKYRHVLEWIDRNVPEAPSAFTDLGCANGLLTLCLSELWPEARGQGIDGLRRAISVARSLARRFDNDRVTFFEADLTLEGAVGQVAPAPLDLAVFVFHEIFARPVEAWQHLGPNIGRLVADSGRLISINRFPRARQQVAVLNDRLVPGGLRPVGEDMLKIGAENFPIVIYERG